MAVAGATVIALKAHERAQPSPAVSPQGEPGEVVAEPDPRDGGSEARRGDRRPRSDTRKKGPKKKSTTRSGGTLSFAGSSGGGYSGPVSTGGGGGGSYSPPVSGSGGGGGTSGDSGGGSGGGGDGGGGQSPPPPQPEGSAKPADLAFWYHWSDDGSYFFTTDFESSQQALGYYDNRAKLGEVWSRSAIGDDLTALCLTPDRCEGYVAERPPKEGDYKALYWHGGGEQGRFFSTDPSATYRGQSLSLYGYIRP